MRTNAVWCRLLLELLRLRLNGGSFSRYLRLVGRHLRLISGHLCFYFFNLVVHLLRCLTDKGALRMAQRLLVCGSSILLNGRFGILPCYRSSILLNVSFLHACGVCYRGGFSMNFCLRPGGRSCAAFAKQVTNLCLKISNLPNGLSRRLEVALCLIFSQLVTHLA